MKYTSCLLESEVKKKKKSVAYSTGLRACIIALTKNFSLFGPARNQQDAARYCESRLVVQQRSQEDDGRNSRLTGWLSNSRSHISREGSEKKQVLQGKCAGDSPDSKRCIIMRHLVARVAFDH